MNKKIILASAIVAIVGTSNANADLITFDEFDARFVGSIEIYDGFHGLDWSGFSVTNGPARWKETGYEYGTVSYSNTAFNQVAAPASFFSTTNYFNVESMYITRAWHSGWTHFEGYTKDILTYSMDVFADTRTPDLIIFNWTGITKFRMSDGCGDCSQTVIDNVIFSMGAPISIPEPLPTPVPEPSTYVMLLAGLGLLGFMGQRRKKFNLS